jgi:hypothetical protein
MGPRKVIATSANGSPVKSQLHATRDQLEAALSLVTAMVPEPRHPDLERPAERWTSTSRAPIKAFEGASTNGREAIAP